MVTFHSTREASPVSKDHQRQPFSVKIIDSLCSLKGRVREPHLTSLLNYLLGIKKDYSALKHINVRVGIKT